MKTQLMCVCGAGLLIAQGAGAYDLPVVNLGLTSFLDGGLPAGPGWYLQEYFQNYSADRLRDKDGKALGLPKQDLDCQVAVTQLSYLSNVRLGNASLGLNAVLPVVTRMKVDDGLNNAALRGQTGMGDLLIGPFIQFDPVMGPAGPRFVQRIELQVNLPTGEYDDKHAINPGNNAWSFNPYWAATYWFTPKWTASVRAHYLYNGKNAAPAQSFGNVSDIQAGQALHANFATEYAVTDQLRLGINGYWLKQITDTQVDGHDVSGRREKVWAIGPGAMYSFSQNDHVFVNAYFEQDVENRPDGSRVQMRYVHHF
ncbi:SphA family protein [Pseudomonas amygdali]|uniref:SphA family protein n=1 Tax=Pseudomonas amygdali TaxID=47877 RepID=UPI0001CC2EB0|nr:transporter [Pseudomonas amygdali]KWT16263.1 phenol degradation protein meta [Pseudomonas amygdali pv. aesculi]KWT17228.1 phenol degradation protein meta [Pseudomonas amygdali pv. aesculi]KWT23461.1 phenol degradation protein meta [Pseudomonas amygdali pv. aesculi]KWT30693.1 phenol degradation protein meta [Pseudomonas amygdali pv. aesculi]KWT33032.1 phenol degradation protein meta [Pseudomonas amygdali pv. aesculi]